MRHWKLGNRLCYYDMISEKNVNNASKSKTLIQIITLCIINSMFSHLNIKMDPKLRTAKPLRCIWVQTYCVLTRRMWCEWKFTYEMKEKQFIQSQKLHTITKFHRFAYLLHCIHVKGFLYHLDLSLLHASQFLSRRMLSNDIYANLFIFYTLPKDGGAKPPDLES